MIADQLEIEIFKSRISASVCIAEAPAHGESVITYSPKSKATKEFIAFVDELIGANAKKGGAKSK